MPLPLPSLSPPPKDVNWVPIWDMGKGGECTVYIYVASLNNKYTIKYEFNLKTNPILEENFFIVVFSIIITAC